MSGTPTGAFTAVSGGSIHSVAIRGTTNHTPIANAGPDQTVECAGATTSVTLDGSGSSDPDHESLIYEWYEEATLIATGVNPTVPLTHASHTLSLVVTDPSGASASDTVVINVVDTTAPVPDVATLPDVTGECSATITSAPTATDTCVGTITGTTTDPLTRSTPGTSTVTWHYDDGNGNVSIQTQKIVVSDTTAPVISGVPADIGATPTSVNGAVVTFSEPTASDTSDGPVPVTCTPSSGSQFPLGTTTVSCTATDESNNTATATFTVNVTYSWSGVLQPINADGSSVFKGGSTVPVKFQLTGASAGISNAVANLSYVQCGVTDAQVNEAISTSAADSGSQFRYDPTGQQYIFNMSTKGFTPGAKYKLIIDLHDGVERSVMIGVK